MTAALFYDQRMRREGYEIARWADEAGPGFSLMRSKPAPPLRSILSITPMVRALLAGMVALAACLARADVPAPVPAAQPTGHWREASLEEYRKHLLDLSAIVDACAKARDMKTCDPALVGQDDRVPLNGAPNAERRLVRYGWLRVLLSKAQDADETEDGPHGKPASTPRKPSPEAAVRPPLPTTSQLLAAAGARLTQDLAQADGASIARPEAAAGYTEERDAMNQVLAGRDFRNLHRTSVRDSILERLGNWLNRLAEGAQKLQTRSVWLGRAIVGGFILTVCVGLVWALLQLERRWRIRLVPESDAPAGDAASARDWQLWLKDARRAAAAAEWRQAIHFAYWAAISRLESKRLWPADRARTPREYLALVSREDLRRPGLAALTANFERTWYGGRMAGESDYKTAEVLAAELISGSAADAERPGAAGQVGGAR